MIFKFYCAVECSELHIGEGARGETQGADRAELLSDSSFISSFEQDTILAELLQINKEYIVGYHEHDSLLDHKEEEELTEEERKAAWAEYEAEKKVKLFNLVYVFENNLPGFRVPITFSICLGAIEFCYRPRNEYVKQIVRYPQKPSTKSTNSGCINCH